MLSPSSPWPPLAVSLLADELAPFEEWIYRRNPDLRWPKTAHSIEIDGLRILNPLVTFLYKAHKPRWEPKDMLDLADLIEKAGGS